jgi:hypothetical protein
MNSTPDANEEPAPKLTWSERFKALLAEFGPVLIVVWLGVFGLVWAGFVLAIKFGFGVESESGFWGVVASAYLATQLAKPLRIAATLVITPAAAALLKRFRKPALDAPSAVPVGPPAPTGTSLDETPSGPS